MGFQSSYWVSELLWGFGAHIGFQRSYGVSGDRELVGAHSGGKELIETCSHGTEQI